MSMMEIIIKIDQLNLMRSVWRGGGATTSLNACIFLSVFFLLTNLSVFIYFTNCICWMLYYSVMLIRSTAHPLYCPSDLLQHLTYDSCRSDGHIFLPIRCG